MRALDEGLVLVVSACDGGLHFQPSMRRPIREHKLPITLIETSTINEAVTTPTRPPMTKDMSQDKAVVLLSGGLDSTTCLAESLNRHWDCHALSFDYGQKQIAELLAAKNIADFYRVPHIICKLPIHQFGQSALTDQAIAIPDDEATGNIPETIPITYVPARNTIFLSFALGFAEALNAKHIVIGVSHIDYAGYPDCRPEYINAFEKLANLATKKGVEENVFRLHAPLIYLSKAETIRLGIQLGVDYSLTVTCYRLNETGLACGTCHSCVLRKKGFLEANVPDPTRYQSVTVV